MMRCEMVKELLEAYIEDELDESERKEVQAHVSGCESCKQELALTQSIPSLVSSLSTPPVPEDIIPDTLKRIHEAPATRWRWTGSFSEVLSRRWQLAAVASLLFALLLFGISYHMVNRQPQITEAEVASAAEDIKLALGIVRTATRDVQLVALTEGVRALDIAKSTSEDAMQILSRTQSEVFEKLRRNLTVIGQI